LTTGCNAYIIAFKTKEGRGSAHYELIWETPVLWVGNGGCSGLLTKKGRYWMVVKLGEVQSEMTDDVKKTEDLKVILKVEWKDKIKEIKFKPSEDLKKGDKVKITIEKV
jgi:hypothetical protein